jgi:hypothetical protein
VPLEERKRPSSPKAGGSGGSSGSGSGTAGTGKPRSNSGSSTNEWGVKSFNRSFVRALDEFLDRLGAGGTKQLDVKLVIMEWIVDQFTPLCACLIELTQM